MKLFYSLCTLCVLSLSSIAMDVTNKGSSPFLNWRDRPAEVSNIISQVFDGLKEDNESRWRVNGQHFGSNNTVGIDEYLLMKRIIENAPTQKEYYALDIGAGLFPARWGHGLGEFLNSQEDISKDITVHIISVRGESSKTPETSQDGICKYYEYGGFKVEEITNAFESRGHFFDKKFDLIVSSMCFRHLVDPIGTFVQVYNLLKPFSGLFISDSFFFLLDEEKLGTHLTYKRVAELYHELNAPFFLGIYDGQKGHQHFLRRRDRNDCELPYVYIGFEKEDIKKELEFSRSKYITRFLKMKSQEQKFNWERLKKGPQFDGDFAGNLELYKWFENNGLVAEDPLYGL